MNEEGSENGKGLKFALPEDKEQLREKVKKIELKPDPKELTRHKGQMPLSSPFTNEQKEEIRKAAERSRAKQVIRTPEGQLVIRDPLGGVETYPTKKPQE